MGGRGASSSGGGGGSSSSGGGGGGGGMDAQMNAMRLKINLSNGMSLRAAVARVPGTTIRQAKEMIASGKVPNRTSNRATYKNTYHATDQQLH